MIGSIASTFSGRASRCEPRSAYKAISAPSTVVPVAVISASASVFHATPQRTPPATQPRPQMRSCPSRSASTRADHAPSSSTNAPIRLLPTGSATNSSSNATDSTTAPATNRSPRNRPSRASPAPSSMTSTSTTQAPPSPMPNCPDGNAPNSPCSHANDQPRSPIANPAPSTPTSPATAAVASTRPCARPLGSHAPTSASSSAAPPLHSHGLPCRSACSSALAVSGPANTPASACHSVRSCGKYHGSSAHATNPDPAQANTARRARTCPRFGIDTRLKPATSSAQRGSELTSFSQRAISRLRSALAPYLA